jgi:hypothetical protein
MQQMYQEVTGGAGREGVPMAKPQKEKTFFEKHWMFILAFCVLAFNALFGKPPPAGQVQPPAARQQ